MTITEVLENNCKEFGDEVCLVEINPEVKETRRVTWREFELIEPNPTAHCEECICLTFWLNDY